MDKPGRQIYHRSEGHPVFRPEHRGYHYSQLYGRVGLQRVPARVVHHSRRRRGFILLFLGWAVRRQGWTQAASDHLFVDVCQRCSSILFYR